MTVSRLARLAELHARGEPIVMLTAYDYPSARIAEAGGVDVVLVGDSAAMTVLGYSSTRDISIDELVMLTRAARRALADTPVIGDLPFGSYEESDAQAVRSARRFMDEAGCDAVKLEGAGPMLPRVRAILEAGIPVFGHVGLLPQSVRTREGYRARGRDPEQAIAIVRDSDDLAAAGCSALIIEAVPPPVASIIVERIDIPLIGIGAGVVTDGQVLVYHDLLGFTEGRLPRFRAPVCERARGSRGRGAPVGGGRSRAGVSGGGAHVSDYRRSISRRSSATRFVLKPRPRNADDAETAHADVAVTASQL